MNISDIRADIIHGIMGDQHTAILAHESADNDNVILVTGSDGNRYKLTITKLP